MSEFLLSATLKRTRLSLRLKFFMFSLVITDGVGEFVIFGSLRLILSNGNGAVIISGSSAVTSSVLLLGGGGIIVGGI